MRFFSPLLSLSISALAATAVVAQAADIGAPAYGTEVAAGSSFNVMITQSVSPTTLENIDIIIGLLNCGEFSPGCLGPSEGLGTILFTGPFNPQFTTPLLPYHENYTLTIPSDFDKGQSQLGAALLDLSGALLAPYLQTFNTTIVVT